MVRPSGRLRGILGESAVSRLCGRYAHHFPQLALNAAEPWPFQDFALKIYVKPNSWSQTLFTSRLSIGGEKNLTHLNCGQCPSFVCWSSRVGQPSATSQDKTSEEPIQNVIWPPGSIADSQRSNAGNLWGFSIRGVFHPLKCTLLTKIKMTNDFFFLRRFPWWHEVLKKKCRPSLQVFGNKIILFVSLNTGLMGKHLSLWLCPKWFWQWTKKRFHTTVAVWNTMASAGL